MKNIKILAAQHIEGDDVKHMIPHRETPPSAEFERARLEWDAQGFVSDEIFSLLTLVDRADLDDYISSEKKREMKFIADSKELYTALKHTTSSARNIWPCYIKLIHAAPESEEYARHALELAEACVRASDPLLASPSLLCHLKTLANGKYAWPGFLSKHESVSDIESRKLTILEVGKNALYKKLKSNKNEASTFAEYIVNILREIHTLATQPMMTLGYPLKHWKYYYIIQKCPPFNSAHIADWEIIAKHYMDMNHGTEKIRTAALLQHYKSFAKNPTLIPEGHSFQLNTMREENEHKASPSYATEMVHRDNVLHARLAIEFGEYGEFAINDVTYHETFPCILAQKNIQEYCARNIQSPVTSADALYRQFRKDVIHRVCKMLLRSMDNEERTKIVDA